jgi:hypothetical protein
MGELTPGSTGRKWGVQILSPGVLSGNAHSPVAGVKTGISFRMGAGTGREKAGLVAWNGC